MTEVSTVGRGRRRGTELEDAIYAATLAELAAVGYGGLTMEGVAARARTGKAALYRRWSTKRDLTLAALRHGLPALPEPDPDRSARDNLLAVFTAVCAVFTGQTPLPGLNMAVDLLREPELRVRFAEDVVAPRKRVIESILDNGVQAGEISPTTLKPMVAETGPALIMQTILLTGRPPTRHELGLIVDTVLRQP